MCALTYSSCGVVILSEEAIGGSMDGWADGGMVGHQLPFSTRVVVSLNQRLGR